jgi:hypothetical protein
VPAQISFAIEGGPAVTSERVTVISRLSNDSAEPQRIVVFPTGPGGFMLQAVPGAAERIPQPGPPTPPVPPPPLAFTLPAKSRLRLETTFQLSA